MMKKSESLSVLLLILLIPIFGCDNAIKFNPAASSLIQGEGGGSFNGLSNNSQTSQSWSPYIVVHTPGEALSVYREIIPNLMISGALRGVRINITRSEGKNSVNEWIANTGLDVLWVLDNYYLFEPNIEQVIDQVMRWYPNITYLQIGNEITTILPENGQQMSIEDYMRVLKRIYNYVQNRYPFITLVSQSTFGSGSYGSEELEKMVNLGLKDIPSNKLIVGMNVYSLVAASNYSHIVNYSLRGYRIWVTESGSNEPSNHMNFVQKTYPFIRNNLRAERIYWYCLYCGESGTDVGFGLIREIFSRPFWASPLYNELVGGR